MGIEARTLGIEARTLGIEAQTLGIEARTHRGAAAGDRAEDDSPVYATGQPLSTHYRSLG